MGTDSGEERAALARADDDAEGGLVTTLQPPHRAQDAGRKTGAAAKRGREIRSQETGLDDPLRDIAPRIGPSELRWFAVFNAGISVGGFRRLKRVPT